MSLRHVGAMHDGIARGLSQCDTHTETIICAPGTFILITFRTESHTAEHYIVHFVGRNIAHVFSCLSIHKLNGIFLWFW